MEDTVVASETAPTTVTDGSPAEPTSLHVNGAVIDDSVSGDAGRGSESAMSGEMTVKRKRGRPRKFDLEATTTLWNEESPPTPPGVLSSKSTSNSEKRGRGRPRGSGKLQLLAALGGFAAETAGGSIIPHVIIVNPGEDVVSKIWSFAQKGPRAVCILSATGVVSSVMIKQPGTAAGLLRYEGRFEILSLCGSFTFNEKQTKIGNLSISLAKPDGKVFGGCVVGSGSLIASAPIQIIVASFKQNISKELKLKQLADSSPRRNLEIVKYPLQIEETAVGEEECEDPQPISEKRVISPNANSAKNDI